MQVFALKYDDPAARMIRDAHRGYTGRRFSLSIHERGGMSLTSYWSGGSRDYHVVIRLEDGARFAVPENGSGFTAVDHAFGPAGLPLELPAPGFAVATWSRGYAECAALAIHRENAAKLLPAPQELTRDEKIVLVYTRSLKAAFRYAEARSDQGITQDRWEEAKTACIARGFLNRAGAITVDGRNAVSGLDTWTLKETAAQIESA